MLNGPPDLALSFFVRGQSSSDLSTRETGDELLAVMVRLEKQRLRSRSSVTNFTAELPKGGVEVRPLPDWAFWI